MKRPIYFLILFVMMCWAGMLRAQDYVEIYVSPPEGCKPLYVNANNLSSFTFYEGIVNYQWRINGMPVSTDPSMIDTTLTEGGRYNIELEAFDSTGNPLGRDEWEIEVRGVSYFNIYPSNVVCPGEMAGIDLHYNGMIYNMQWDLGGGDIRYENHQSVMFESTGVYPIQLIAETDCGTDTVVQELIVSDTIPPTPEIYTSGDRFCPGDPIEFETSYKDYPVEWNMGDGTILHGPRVVYSYPALGAYAVSATVTNACGLSAAVTDTVFIENGVEVWAGFNWWPEQGDNCPGSPIRFNSHSSGFLEWKFGDGTSSNENEPVHFYAEPGMYNVRLIVNNACGNSDTAYQEVMIEYRDYEYIGFDPYFRFDRDYSSEYADTLYLCPGEMFEALLDGGGGPGGEIEYVWNLGNGTILGGDRINYAYETGGLYELSLSIQDQCHRYSNPSSRWIVVDPLIEPKVQLNYAPMELCPGEEVYFWDEGWWEDDTDNTYDIVFGDGASQSNITDISDHELNVLAYHTYSAEGNYPFTFSATNLCGNTFTLEDTIRVSIDPDRKPFYHVSNSTSDDEGGSGGPGSMEMWNMPKDSTDHEFVIDVQWSDWSSALNDTFYIYAWYGGFNPEGESGDPAGMAMYTSADISIGDVFSIFVPVNPQAPPEVGFAVGWYCEPGKMDDEPDVWSTLMTTLGDPIPSLPLYEGGVTNTIDTTGAPVMLGPWNGICRANSIDGSWRGYANNGKVVFLSFYEDQGMMSYNLDIADDEMWTNSVYITGGNYDQSSDTDLMLMPNSGPCSETAMYTIEHMEEGFMLHISIDNCSEQAMYLDSVMFYRDNTYGGDDGGGKHKEPVCPGDPVKFEIAGGSSYVWHFGDGTTSTEQFPLHIYDSAGMYEAMVVATNNCGRVDTIMTPVEVRDDHLPYAYFHFDKWDFKVGDTVFFMPDMHEYELAEFYNYTWNFGDNTTSTNMLATHVYNAPGPYQVTLMVENGCGISEESMEIYVQDRYYHECDVEARFDFEIHNDSVYLHNFSWGDSLEVHWDFGNGTGSNKWAPVVVYTEPGFYPICLSVYDPIQDCADQICMEVMIGQFDCYAEFNYTVNNSNNTVHFFDQSENANKWFWYFGDGTQSFKREPIHVFPEPGWYMVSLGIEDTLTGCFGHREKEIWVGEIDTTSSCFLSWDYFVDSNTVTYNAEATGNITDGFWDFGDGTFGYDPNISHTYTQPGNYYVCAYVFDSISGCQAERCEEISIGENICKANFVFIVDSASSTVEFIDKSLGTFTESYIDFGDGKVSLVIDTVHTYPGPGEYWVCLTVYNNLTDCYDELCKRIWIPGIIEEPTCEATFTYIPISGTMKVQFRENSLTDFNSWYWNFDNGRYDTLQNPIHTFTAPGVYEVCMSAYNSETDCFDDICRNVTVEGADLAPPLSANFSTIINTQTSRVKFRNKSTGNVNTAYWIFGDGTSGESTDTIVHQYQPGMYRVCLIVTNDVGKTDEYCKVITVGEPPCLITSAFDYHINAVNKELRLTNESSGRPNKWFWTFGDGTTSSKPSPVKRYTKSGYYLISLAVRDTITGCSDYSSELVQVGDIDCRADFTYSVNPTLRDVTFTNTSIGNPQYSYWLFSDGSSSVEENPVHNFAQNGLYHVGLAINGSGGLCNSLMTKAIQVGDVDCNADFQVYVDSSLNKAYFDAELIGEATNLVWTFGDGGIAQGLSTKHQYTAPGFYTVGLSTFNTANGCMDYTEQTVLIGASGIDVEPDFFFRVDEGTLTVDFVDNSVGNVTDYLWDFGDGNTSSEQNPSYSYTSSDFYNVCLTVESGSVANTKCKKIEVSNTDDACLAQFILNVDSAARAVTFTDISIGEPDTWAWTFSDGQTFSTQNPEVTFDTAGIYRVEFDIANSSTGCESSSFSVINVAKGATGLLAAFIYDVDESAAKAGLYPVDLVAYPGTSAANYFWDLGDGYTYSGATEFTHIYTEEGDYNVCFTISDDVTGESATDCQTVSTTTGTTIPDDPTDPVSTYAMEKDNRKASLSAYPNPFTDYTLITYTLEKAGEIELDVYDETGRHISNIIRTYKEAEAHSFYWDSGNIESGVYVIQLKATDGSLLKHTSVVKQ